MSVIDEYKKRENSYSMEKEKDEKDFIICMCSAEYRGYEYWMTKVEGKRRTKLIKGDERELGNAAKILK